MSEQRINGQSTFDDLKPCPANNVPTYTYITALYRSARVFPAKSAIIDGFQNNFILRNAFSLCANG